MTDPEGDSDRNAGAHSVSEDNGEKRIEEWICATLARREHDPGALAELRLCPENSAITDVRSLVGHGRFKVVRDNSIWNTHPGLMVDIIGGMTPDIVIQSRETGENRIIIEVKHDAVLGHDEDACQLTRYLLHLLATSKQSKSQDIQRAVILAAPGAWFEVPANARGWERFVTRYGPLAAHFGVLLGVLHTPPQFD